MPETTSATGKAIAVSVVVPTCGRMDLLDRCLDALARQTLLPGSYEVIVVDDGPSHNTLHLVAGWRARTLDRGVRLVYLANAAEHGQHGAAATRNLGWRAAQAPIAAFTDDDGVQFRKTQFRKTQFRKTQFRKDFAPDRDDRHLGPDSSAGRLLAPGRGRPLPRPFHLRLPCADSTS